QGNLQKQAQENFNSLNSRVEELTDKSISLDINQGNLQKQAQENFNSLNSRIEKLSNLTEIVENLINKISKLEDNTNNNFNETKKILNKIEPHRYELIYGRPDIRSKLFSALKETNQTLIMVCPWISQNAVDPDLLQHIQQALKNNNVTIHIGWGNLYDINSAKKSAQVLLAKSSYNAFNSLQKLQCIQFKLLGTHEKFLICDDKWALITSYNFLSASDFKGVKGEREIGLLTYDKNIIKELKDHYEKSPEYSFP
ncbi:MAG: phospholipase D-like domain-containing protein, partial [Pseudanabaena sp. ELA645]